jgi:hypothetical protein
MKTIYNVIQTFFLGFALLFLSSCNRDKNNAPVDIELNIKSNSELILNGNLTTEELYINLSKIDIIGTREVGENVNFTRGFSNRKKFNLINSSPEFLNLPEGTYNSLLFNLSLINNPEDNDLLEDITDWLEDFNEGEDDLLSLQEDLGEIIEGYINNRENTLFYKGKFTFNNHVKHVVFVLNNQDVLNLFSANTMDNQKLSLSKDVPMSAKIVFNPTYWFGNISATILNDAFIGIMDDKPYILINKYINTHLYTNIFNRIEESTTFILETK